MKKIVRYGWVGKKKLPKIIVNPFSEDNELQFIGIFQSSKKSWFPEDYPPRNVKITIEEIK